MKFHHVVRAAVVAASGLAFALPAGAVAHPDARRVPEGGTALLYLLVAGVACLGAFALRSRKSKANRIAT